MDQEDGREFGRVGNEVTVEERSLLVSAATQGFRDMSGCTGDTSGFLIFGFQSFEYKSFSSLVFCSLPFYVTHIGVPFDSENPSIRTRF